MESSHETKSLIKAPKNDHCRFCNKTAGIREYRHFDNATILGCMVGCIIFPVFCTVCCYNEDFQDRKEFCLNCNRILSDE